MSRGATSPAVLLFGPWPLPYGGVSVFMERLRSQLILCGHDVSVLGYGEFQSAPQLHRVPLMHEPWKYSMIRIALASRGGRVLHDNSGVMSYPEEHVVYSYTRMLRLLRIPWVLSLHDSTLPQRFENFSKRLRDDYASLLARVDHLIVTEDHIRDFVVALGIDEDHTTVVSPLLPLEARLSPPPEQFIRFASDHSPVLLTTGAYVPIYDLLTVLRGFERLLEHRPDAGLIVVRTGFATDSVYAQQIQECLDRVGSRCLVLSDLPNPQFVACLRSVDVFIRGLDAVDSLGLSRMEAIMAGVPTVATKSRETSGVQVYDYGDSQGCGDAIENAIVAEGDFGLKAAQRRYAEIADRNLATIRTIYSGVSRSGAGSHG